MLLSFQLYAGDLIYKSSFENKALVAGTAIGINSTGLVLQLTSGPITENLFVDSNSPIVFSSSLAIGTAWSVSIASFPSDPTIQTCSISNNSGIMPASGVGNLLVTCDGSLNWNSGNWDEWGWQ